MNDEDRSENTYLVRSVEKALKILELFDESRPSLTLPEIVELTGMNRVTTYRFCRTLETLGYLQPTSQRGYRPGVKVLHLGRAALTSRDLREIAVPALERLQEQTGLTANMAVRDGNEIVYLARIRSDAILTIRLFEGSRLPVHCTSMGKVILAFLPDHELKALLPSISFQVFTPNTIKNQRELLLAIEQARTDEYAVNDEEYAPGLRGIAAPLLDGNRYPVAAINLAAASPIPTRELEERFGAAVVDTASSISDIWGTVTGRSSPNSSRLGDASREAGPART